MKNLLTLTVVVCLCGMALGQVTETVLYSFGSYPTDGAFPQGGLILDSANNIYGTTSGGGKYCQSDGGCGTVYELTPGIGNALTEVILYDFCPTQNPPVCPDGSIPYAGLIKDAAGNLYGTTSFGGPGGYGTVFRLSPPSNGSGNWIETVLWSFDKARNNGTEPGYGKLNIDAAGNIFGTTVRGGAHNFGVVFELTPNGDGTYSFTIIHSFSGKDGAGPMYGVAFDNEGNLYGTTEEGGIGQKFCTNGCGVVYKLSPSNGTWQQTVLYMFNGVTGAYPISPISVDQSGNLYGTFEIGGIGSCFFGTCGGVFKLVPEPGGGGQRYTFYFNGDQGNGGPTNGVLVGGNNVLFGSVGAEGAGNVYVLSGGHQTILYNFCSLPNCADGSGPAIGTIVSHQGMLYGNTYLGGVNGVGVVYSLEK